MQKGSWGGSAGRGRGGAGGPRYTPATGGVTSTTTAAVPSSSSTKSTKPPTTKRAATPSRPSSTLDAFVTKIEAAPAPTTAVGSESVDACGASEGFEVIYTVGYGGLKTTEAFVERLKGSGITRLLDIRISPHCGFNRDFTGRAMGVLLRKQGIAYEHFMELGNVWRSDDSEAELDAPTKLRLYRELMSTAGELLTRRLRQRVQSASHERIAILCACGDVRECHRSIVASYLHDAHHYTVRHI